MSNRALYFVAIVLPEPLSSEVRKLQEYTANHFNSRHALKSPPHLTLVAPFAVYDAANTPGAILAKACSLWKPLNVTLEGFGNFGRRVIFVRVLESPEMAAMARGLSEQLRAAGFDVRVETRPFHPHVTLAFRDLSPGMFQRAFDYFNALPFSAEFQARHIALLKHEQGRWHVTDTYPLGGR